MVQELERLRKEYEALISRKNEKCNKNNGVYVRYKNPVLTAEHAPLIWRYRRENQSLYGGAYRYQCDDEFGCY